MGRRRTCWLAQFSEIPCDGQLRKCHLIPKQTIRREIGKRYEWDERSWVWGCGGPTGIGGHHGMLDYSRKLRIPRHALPSSLEEFAEAHGLGWYLDRTYGAL